MYIEVGGFFQMTINELYNSNMKNICVCIVLTKLYKYSIVIIIIEIETLVSDLNPLLLNSTSISKCQIYISSISVTNESVKHLIW